jgi:hypothetical protein
MVQIFTFHFIVYKAYFVAAKIGVVFPLLLLAILLFQGASVLSPYWCVFKFAQMSRYLFYVLPLGSSSGRKSEYTNLSKVQRFVS